MNSPFPVSSSVPGEGRIVVGLTPSGDPSLESIAFQYPLKLIAPDSRSHSSSTAAASISAPADNDSGRADGQKSALVFLLSYGGGLVAGDQVNLTIDVRQGARLSLVTQGTTKVFKAPSSGTAAIASPAALLSQPQDVVTRQTLRMHVAVDAALCLLPDPVQPFADSVYEQLQVVWMAADRPHDDGSKADGSTATTTAASLCLLDWVTQGRAARGEHWNLRSWTGRNEVWLVDSVAGAAEAHAKKAGRLLMRDAVLLAPGLLQSGSHDASSDVLCNAMHGLAVFGTLLLRGPLVSALGDFFLAEFAALPRLGSRGFRDGGIKGNKANGSGESSGPASATLELWRADRLLLEQQHGVLWTAAAVRGCVVVKFGARTVEGARLWIGGMLVREGSIAAVFGEQALMCVRP